MYHRGHVVAYIKLISSHGLPFLLMPVLADARQTHDTNSPAAKDSGELGPVHDQDRVNGEAVRRRKARLTVETSLAVPPFLFLLGLVHVAHVAEFFLSLDTSSAQEQHEH